MYNDKEMSSNRTVKFLCEIFTYTQKIVIFMFSWCNIEIDDKQGFQVHLLECIVWVNVWFISSPA